ncbi:hypothetical protein T492DRAFT_429316 [Pavlovales sp. CCMP2436]|nr:hypothetical protein T492DRAFT_429316 [Pavlovales sp. CCMP2436]
MKLNRICHIYICSLQAHMSRVHLPISDYISDTKGVLDQALRVLQAMVDIAADAGSLPNTLGVMSLYQCVVQAAWPITPQLQILPHMTPELAASIGAKEGGKCGYIAQLIEMSDYELNSVFAPLRGERERRDILRALRTFPLITMTPQLDREKGLVSSYPNISFSIQGIAGNKKGEF